MAAPAGTGPKGTGEDMQEDPKVRLSQIKQRLAELKEERASLIEERRQLRAGLRRERRAEGAEGEDD